MKENLGLEIKFHQKWLNQFVSAIVFQIYAKELCTNGIISQKKKTIMRITLKPLENNSQLTYNHSDTLNNHRFKGERALC